MAQWAMFSEPWVQPWHHKTDEKQTSQQIETGWGDSSVVEHLASMKTAQSTALPLKNKNMVSFKDMVQNGSLQF